jgi:hypothetical protein
MLTARSMLCVPDRETDVMFDLRPYIASARVNVSNALEGL